VDVILNVVRCFDDANIGHVEESVDPVRDISIIANELMFSDLEQVTDSICLIHSRTLYQVENRIKKGQAKLKAQNSRLFYYFPRLKNVLA
jgi:ribosome-binding ATPase YchF (GTP1/OBG family)